MIYTVEVTGTGYNATVDTFQIPEAELTLTFFDEELEILLAGGVCEADCGNTFRFIEE